MAANDTATIVIQGSFTPEAAGLVLGELVTHEGRPYVVTWAQADIRGDLTLQLSESLTLAEQVAAVAERSAGAQAAMAAGSRSGRVAGGRRG